MTSSIRQPGWTPPGSDGGDGQGRIVGYDVTSSVDVDLPALYYYRHPAGGGPATLIPILYNTGTQTAIATGSSTSPGAATGWVRVPFDTTQHMTAGTTYTWAVWQSAGALDFADHDLASPITDTDIGKVTALANTGRFLNDTAVPAWPGQGSGDFMHGIDGEFSIAATAITGTDAASLTDSSSIAAAVAPTDSAALTDASSITATAGRTDAATLAEVSAVTASAHLTDAATFSDTSHVAKPGTAGLDVRLGAPVSGWALGNPVSGWTLGEPR